ncbi:MAG: 4'-phosphopantetheinyl transferase superfamily protein [Lachnospiraceae bacterium]|nr:4'-phosphopantetheinyl transferase superfamily protein [Lachnospiraceae bacterium]
MEAPRARLLKEVLREAGVNAYAALFTPEMLGHTEDGKPFFPDLPQIHFSLSHSGEYIACAFSDEEVGLDLQECSRPRTSIFRIAKRFFSQAEYEAILALSADKAAESCINDSGSDSPGNPDDPECLSLFYRLWSIKEAYLKYLGCGLRGGLDGYVPDPLPSPIDIKADSSSTSCNTTDVKPDSPSPSCSPDIRKNVILRGRIRVLRDNTEGAELSPAQYALLTAPDGYTMAVCANTLPEEISIRHI